MWLAWLLVLTGGGPGAPYVLRMLRATLSAPAFTAVVEKLLAAGDADRVVRLSLAAGVGLALIRAPGARGARRGSPPA
jgi:hypothetical protein